MGLHCRNIFAYKFELQILSYICFRYDLDLPVILDYEIWKASHMLFQNIPYDVDTDADTENDENWDDSWDSRKQKFTWYYIAKGL